MTTSENPKPLSPQSWARLLQADALLRKTHGVGFIDVEAIGQMAKYRAEVAAAAAKVVVSVPQGDSAPSESAPHDAEPKETPMASQDSP